MRYGSLMRDVRLTALLCRDRSRRSELGCYRVWWMFNTLTHAAGLRGRKCAIAALSAKTEVIVIMDIFIYCGIPLLIVFLTALSWSA